MNSEVFNRILGEIIFFKLHCNVVLYRFIIPVALKTDFWGNAKKYVKDLGAIDRTKPIYMEFGEAINVDGTGKEEHSYIVDFIIKRLQKWRNSGDL